MTASQSYNMRSTFTWDRVRPDIVAVVDLDDGMLQIVSCSVTNDAENVIRFLVREAQLRDGDRVIYRDTTGRWDELLHQGGRFEGFAAIGAHSQELAVFVLQEERQLQR